MFKRWYSPLALAVLVGAGLAACSTIKLPGVYRIDIQQGNVVTPKMLDQLEIGMDKRKVRFVLGTPLVTDAFHQDRWDYFYSYEPGSGRRVQQRVALFFEEERLARVEAQVSPDLDFHTVVEARESVFVVPQDRGSGFFAALFSGSSSSEVDGDARSEDAAGDEATTAASESSLPDVGSTEGDSPVPPPATETAATPSEAPMAVGAAGATPAATGTAGDEIIAPREIYAPNASTGVSGEAAGFGNAETTSESSGTVGFSTAESRTADSATGDDDSQYLESLFEDFGTSSQPPAETAPPSEPAGPPGWNVDRPGS